MIDRERRKNRAGCDGVGVTIEGRNCELQLQPSFFLIWILIISYSPSIQFIVISIHF